MCGYTPALTPIYGSAEHFGISMKRMGELPRIMQIDAARLEDDGVAEEMPSEEKRGYPLGKRRSSFEAEAPGGAVSLASGSGSSHSSGSSGSSGESLASSKFSSSADSGPGAARRSKPLVSCGPPLPGVEIIIVDPESLEIVPEGTVVGLYKLNPGDPVSLKAPGFNP